MLSDREWQRLRDVERRILADDPDFARSFETSAEELGRSPLDGLGLQIFLVCGALVSGLLLVTGSVSGALGFAAATLAIWCAWRYSVAGPRRS